MRFVLSFLFGFLILAAQDTPPTAENSCAVEVKATNAVTHQPVPHADVRFNPMAARSVGQAQTFVQPADLPAAYGGRTGADGTLTARLPVGQYNLQLSRVEFLNTQYGARRPGSMGPGAATVSCTAGASLSLSVEMTPQAVLSGRVLDDDDLPVRGVQLMLQSQRYLQGKRGWSQIGWASADDRGMFRFSEIGKGKYIVLAQPANFPDFNGRGNVIPLNASGGATTYVATYYPGVTDPAQAMVFDLAAGQELSNLDFRLRRGAAFHIRGRVQDSTVDSSGSPGIRPFINVMRRTEPGEMGGFIGGPGVQAGADGRFNIPNVAPGSYLLNVNKAGNPPAQAMVPVTVSGDVDDLIISLQPGFTVSGTYRVDSSDKLELRSIFVSLVSDPPVFGNTRSEGKLDGGFTVKNLSPARYRFQVSAPNAKVYLASIQWNGREYGPGDEFDFSSAASGFELIFRTDVGSGSGAVTSDNGAVTDGIAVYLPAEPKRWINPFIRQAGVQAGRYTMPSIPPGDYLVFAIESFDYFGIWSDPEWMKENESKMKSVKVTPSSTVSVDAPLLPGPK